MYERFTDRARKVMQLANFEAQTHNHEFVRTTHILVGLLKEGNGVAGHVLTTLGVEVEALRQVCLELCPEGKGPVGKGKLPFTPKTKIVIENALAEVKRLGHGAVGTEHIILGLLALGEEEDVMRVLGKFNLTADMVRGEVMRLLGVERGEEEEKATDPFFPLPGYVLPADASSDDRTKMVSKAGLTAGVLWEWRTDEKGDHQLWICTRGMERKAAPIQIGTWTVTVTATEDGIRQSTVAGSAGKEMKGEKVSDPFFPLSGYVLPAGSSREDMGGMVCKAGVDGVLGVLWEWRTDESGGSQLWVTAKSEDVVRLADLEKQISACRGIISYTKGGAVPAQEPAELLTECAAVPTMESVRMAFEKRDARIEELEQAIRDIHANLLRLYKKVYPEGVGVVDNTREVPHETVEKMVVGVDPGEPGGSRTVYGGSAKQFKENMALLHQDLCLTLIEKELARCKEAGRMDAGVALMDLAKRIRGLRGDGG